MINITLLDDQYDKREITHTRYISRGVVLDENNNVAVLHLIRDDIFGKYDYFELPGGGIDENETPEDGAIREVHEELGVISHIVTKLGVVEDFYNLIKRRNMNHYYLLKVDRKAHQHLEEYETIMLMDIRWVSIDKAIELFATMPDDGVSLLVKRRELPILIEASKIIKGLDF